MPAHSGSCRTRVEEVAVPGEDDLGVGDDHLLHRGAHEPALARRLGDIAAARALDDLGVDGADDAGLEPVGAARKIDARALVRRALRERRVDLGEGVLDVAWQAARRAP